MFCNNPLHSLIITELIITNITVFLTFYLSCNRVEIIYKNVARQNNQVVFENLEPLYNIFAINFHMLNVVYLPIIGYSLLISFSLKIRIEASDV